MLRLSTVLHKASCNRPLRKTRPRCSGTRIQRLSWPLPQCHWGLGFRVLHFLLKEAFSKIHGYFGALKEPAKAGTRDSEVFRKYGQSLLTV